MATPTAEATGSAGPDAGELLGGFRRSSPYFKWRVAVVSGWVVLSALAVAFALTGGEHNDLGASITVVPTVVGTAFNIQNHGQSVWEDVTVTLAPGGWIHRQANVRPGDGMSLAITEFQRPGPRGRPERPRRDFMPRAVTVRTAQASYTKRLHGRR